MTTLCNLRTVGATSSYGNGHTLLILNSKHKGGEVQVIAAIQVVLATREYIHHRNEEKKHSPSGQSIPASPDR